MAGLAYGQKLNWIDSAVAAPVLNDLEQLYGAKKTRLQLETTQKQAVRVTLGETVWYNKGATLLVSEGCKIVRELATLKELAGRSRFEVEFNLSLSKKVRAAYRLNLSAAECKR